MRSGKLRRSRVGIVTALSLVGAMLAIENATTSSASGPAEGIAGFRDAATGSYLQIELDPERQDAGQFIITIPGTGILIPTQAAAIDLHSAHSIAIRYDGDARLDATAKVDREFGVLYQPSGATEPASLRVIGQVDPDQHTESIEIWVNGQHYHMGAQAQRPDAAGALTAVIDAIEGNDWATLYTLSDDITQQGMTQQQFIDWYQQGLGGSHVISVNQTSPLSYLTEPTGVVYAFADLTVTEIRNGAQVTTSGTARLILEPAGWRLFDLNPASSS